METTEIVTTEAPQEEVKGWLSFEDKKKLVDEYNAVKERGDDGVAFAASKGISIWSLIRYDRQVRKAEKRPIVRTGRPFSRSPEERASKVAEVKVYHDQGWNLVEACKKAGITHAQYKYWSASAKGKRWTKLGERKTRQYAPRKVKSVTIQDQDFNKSLRARIVTLEKLVIELSLDKQALLERIEGVI